MIRIGTASWAIPSRLAGEFGPGDSTLERYAQRFDAVEINSSFYRPHRPQTYSRWAECVPDTFRFAVKVPRTITHDARLVGCGPLLDAFLDQARHLGRKLGPLLIQLPPSFTFDADRTGAFLVLLRRTFEGAAVCEPRHPTWFGSEAEQLLAQHGVARVAADPAPASTAGEPGGWASLAYHRLHGSPRIYYSAYTPAFLGALAESLRRRQTPETWCIFDNTALGAATDDALRLLRGLGP